MNKTSSRLVRIAQTFLLAFGLVTVITILSDKIIPLKATETSQSPFGPYLAGRVARANRDTAAAADFYKEALDRDPSNERILEEAFFLEATAGNWDRTEALAQKLIKKEPKHALAQTFLGLDAFKSGQYDEAMRRMSVRMRGPIAELTANLSRAWTYFAMGEIDKAIKLVSDSNQADWVNFYKQYHRGLIADLSGDTKTAEEAFAAIFSKDPRALRVASTYARFAARNGNIEHAKQILEKSVSRSGKRAETTALLKMLDAGEPLPRLVSNPLEGLAEVYYGFGDALSADNGIDMATIYLQFALHLRPDFPVALAALGNAYETIAHTYEKANKPNELVNPKYELAIKAYDKIPADNPMWPSIQIRKAYDLNSLDKVEEAKAILVNIAEKYEPESTRPLMALGDILRSHKRFKEASEFYARAIALVPTPEKKHWNMFYSRGVCFERMKEWSKAEGDLKKALELNPDQPLVLNYLGYSWIDQNMHLEEAMNLIRKAVTLKPDDGYFVDSLGWAYYRQNEFKEATRQLEKAVELRPDDPVINDHLGDAYWKVGRRNEAKFQWSQSLTLKPEPEEAEKIKEKLKNGLTDKELIKTMNEKSGSQ